jgi:hypothetical protein
MSGFTERHVKRVLAAHPTRFVTVSGDTDGGRGKAKRWARIAADSKGWAQRMDEADEIPF